MTYKEAQENAKWVSTLREVCEHAWESECRCRLDCQTNECSAKDADEQIDCMCKYFFYKRLSAMKLLGKLLNLIGVLGCIFAVAMQVYLNFEQFGKWYSGYIVIHWSLVGLLGLFLFPIGYRLMEKSGKRERREKDKENKQ